MRCGVCGSEKIMNSFAIKDHSISNEMFHIADCADCGMRYTHDAPLESKCGVYYQSEDYVSHSNTNKGFIFSIYHRVRSYMLDRKAKLIHSYHTKGNILDMGCGTGYFANHMKEKGYEVLGIEIDDTARQYGIDHFGIKAVSPTALKSGEIKQTFDAITLWHVLEHLYEPKEYMSLFSKHMNLDSILVIAVPNHTSRDSQSFGDYWAAYDVPRHLWHFDPVSMAKLAAATGFKIVEKRQMPFDPFYNSMLSAKYQGAMIPMLNGFWVGLRAYLGGKSDVNRASSIIYVMKKV
jgi:2-polyprenyl-3-methyl-5-hydroxy-6-metoxy-1,4-benzoquinol methylase